MTNNKIPRERIEILQATGLQDATPAEVRAILALAVRASVPASVREAYEDCARIADARAEEAFEDDDEGTDVGMGARSVAALIRSRLSSLPKDSGGAEEEVERVARALWIEQYGPEFAGGPDAPTACDPDGCNPELHAKHTKLANWTECADLARAAIAALSPRGSEWTPSQIDGPRP
ncbi:MAG: hypothetical protein KGL39_25180 [Patescibacteria group bacterium]|nr:hypothetical protein [Patescibacteria group bacterium]